MKKVLSFVLVLSLVLGSMGMAFAAPSFEDIDDEDVLKAVERLSAFGIVEGYEDGSYKPENDITRAEFAKLLVEALGLGSAAGVSGSSQFSDVPATAWYAGYVSVASGQGLVKGMGDGTFAPNKNVSYAEAVTMLVRALGYKDEFLPGSWPGNYVAKAAELEITKKVSFAANGFANRGAVAMMLNNTLDAKVIKQTGYGDENTWSDINTKPLLEEKLGFVKVKEVQVDDIPRFNKNLNDDEVSIDGDVYENVSDIDFDGLWGLEVNIYVDGDELVYAESTDAFKVYYDMVDAEGPKSASKEAGAIDNDSAGEDGEITLVKVDDDFELVDEDDMVIYLYDTNGDLVSGSSIDEYSELEPLLGTGKVFGKFVVNDDNEIQYMELYMSSEVDAGVVVDVDLDRETIEYFGLDSNERKVDLTDEDGYKVYDTEFNPMELEDIKENNVVYIQLVDDKASGDTLHYVFVVTDNTVAGELEEFDEGDEEIQLDGEEYDIARISTVSIDENDTIVDKGDSDFWNNIEDALDEEVTLVFDMVGQVRHITTEAEASSSDMYGVITAVNTDWNDELVKVFTSNGEEVTYELDLDDDADVYTTAYNELGEIQAGDYIVYTLDKDGEIDTIVKVSNNDTLTDINSDSIEAGALEFIVSDSVAIFDVEDFASPFDADDIELVDWAVMKEKDSDGSETFYYVLNSKGVVQAMFFTSGISDLSDDEFAAFAIDVRRTSDGDRAKLDVAGEGIKEYYLKTDGAVSDETIVLFTLNSDNELMTKTYGTAGSDFPEYSTVSGYVYDVDGNYVQVAQTWTDDGDNVVEKDELSNLSSYVLINSDSVIYDDDDKADRYDIDELDEVEVLVKGRTVKVFHIK